MRTPNCRTGHLLLVLLAVFLAGATSAAHGAAVRSAAPGERSAFPGVVILKLEHRLPEGAAKTGFASVDAVLSRHGGIELEPLRRADSRTGKPGVQVDLGSIYFARYGDGAPPEAVAAELARLTGVVYAEPKWVYSIAAVPNDPSYTSTQRLYLERMRFPQGWDVSQGGLGSVVIAVVDGGTDWRHTDLQANIWINPNEIAGNGIDDDLNGFRDDVRGWNFANDTNDPTGLPNLPNNSTHGTHTGGIACAVTNNGLGVAGASWNAELMPICVSSPTNDNSIAFGYEGILYAADNGADIVNASWGGLGSASSFEQDIIQYTFESGTAVVAAAGNQNSSLPHFPSSYPHVLSVANVSRFDVKDATSNYGTTVDVSACGQGILSTIHGGGFGSLTGTSMSSPMAAGLCALVKTRWPGYTPDQVMERVRVTSDNIDQVNPSRAGLLGYGRINAEAALTENTPAVRITNLTFTETDGDLVVEPGETVQLSITVTNFLAPCTGLEFRLRETSAFASAGDSTATLGGLDSLQSVQLPPLSIVVLGSAPIQHLINGILAISSSAPAYTDKDRFSLTVLPTYVTHDASLVTTSVTSVGKLGFSVAIGGNGSDGVGFKYAGSPNLLYEGALLIGTSAGKVSDAARGPSSTSAVPDDDFQTLPGGVPHLSEPGQWAPQQTVAHFDDALAASPLPVQVRQDTYEYVDPVHDDYVILRYTIRNSGVSTINGLRAGWYCDWDIDGGTYETNRTGFDATRQLGYVYDTGTGPDAYVGTSVLNAEGATSYRGIWNDPALAPDWGVYDGFADTEKWECLAGGIAHAEAGPADISNAIATGPFSLAAGDSIEVGFAFLGGANLAALQTNAEAAALKWEHLHSGVPVRVYDLEATQEAGDVVLRWRTADEQDVRAFRVHRATGGGAFEPLAPDLAPSAAGRYEFRDPGLQPGAYTYRIGEVGSDGVVLLHGGGIEVVVAGVPLRSFLAPAAPNPFNPTTMLQFGVARPGLVAIDVFDSRGRHVRTLLHGEVRAGTAQVPWDGRDDAGHAVASGVYVARMRSAGATFTRRMTLLK